MNQITPLITKASKKKAKSKTVRKAVKKAITDTVEKVKERKSAYTIASSYDLRRDVAWNYYIDPKSPTWNNAMQSAIKAGYVGATAKNITGENWWKERLKNFIVMLPLAEKNIIEDLELMTHDTYIIGEGEHAREVTVVNPKLRKLRQDASLFVAETVGKKTYSKKLELENDVKVSLVDGNELIDKLFGK